MTQTSRWAEKPCKKYHPVDEDVDNPECGFCGWLETEHYPREMNKMADTRVNESSSINETFELLKILIDAVAGLTVEVGELKQQMENDHAEIIEKLDNVSKPGSAYGIDETF